MRLRHDLAAAGLLQPVGNGYRLWAALNALVLGAGLAWMALGAADAWQLVNAVAIGVLLVPAGFVAHDAGHGAVTRHAATDARLAWLWWTLLTGLSDAWWRDKHQRHHRHTNDPLRDADLYPIFSYSTADALAARGLKHVIARHQAFALPLLLCATRAWFQLLSLRFALRSPSLRRRELPLMLLHHALFVLLPFLVLGWPLAIAFVLLSYAITGLYMGVVFLTNHTGMPLTHDSATGVAPVVQAAVTRNVRTGRLGDWLWGGLNYQIEHHLVPDLPRRSMAAAVPYVRAFCREQGVAYHSVTPLGAWREVLGHCHRVGATLRAGARPALAGPSRLPRC